MTITDRLAEACREATQAIDHVRMLVSLDPRVKDDLWKIGTFLMEHYAAYDAQRADDAEMITEEWLDSSMQRIGWSGIWRSGPVLYSLSTHTASVGDSVIAIHTRGQLRRIVEAIEGGTP